MNLTNFSIPWLCLGVASLGVLAGCAEGEPIAADFKAVGGKGGHAGHAGSLAAGGSSVENAGTSSPGSGGSGDSGGAGGATSATDSGSAGVVSGDSGTAGGGDMYDGPLSTGLKVEYVAQSGAGLSFTVKITNNGSDSPPLSSFKIRYFLTDEIGIDASGITFDDAAWHTGMNMDPYYQGPKDLLPQVTLTKATPSAYLELSCTKANLALSPKDTLEYHPRVTANGEDQTNDFSYQAGAALAVNPHIVVLQGGNVIAGMAP